MKKSVVAIVVSVFFLLSLGLVMLYSASYPYAMSPQHASQCHGNPFYFVNRQLAFMMVGLVGFLVAVRTDYAIWRKTSWWIWGLALVALALVLIPPFGAKINGARRWLRLGPLGFQPSEFGKLAVIFFLAYCLDRWQADVQGLRFWNWLRLKCRREFLHGFILPMAGMGLIAALIICEPDVGTSVLIGIVGFCMMFVGGVRWWLLIPTYAGAGWAVFEYLSHNPVRWERIIAFSDLVRYKDGAGLQQYQAMLAFGSGGLFGRGLSLGLSKELYMPLAFSDFIAPVIGEELGLVGMVTMLLAFVLLIGFGLFVSVRARDFYGFLLGTGIVCLIGGQALINLAVVTSLMPNKGMPLPFISYGGSNLVVMMCCMGVLVNIARHAGERERALPFATQQLELQETRG